MEKSHKYNFKRNSIGDIRVLPVSKTEDIAIEHVK